MDQQGSREGNDGGASMPSTVQVVVQNSECFSLLEDEGLDRSPVLVPETSVLDCAEEILTDIEGAAAKEDEAAVPFRTPIRDKSEVRAMVK